MNSDRSSLLHSLTAVLESLPSEWTESVVFARRVSLQGMGGAVVALCSATADGDGVLFRVRLSGGSNLSHHSAFVAQLARIEARLRWRGYTSPFDGVEGGDWSVVERANFTKKGAGPSAILGECVAIDAVLSTTSTPGGDLQ